MTENGKGNVDWSRFGLDPVGQSSPPRSNNHDPSSLTASGSTASGNPNVKDLFDEEQGDQVSDKPWWKANFFVREPVLFGTWDGVFTSCMLNIFGVVIFLRTGWVVGNAGIGLSLLIIVLTLLVALAPALSAIGICERTHVESGGVYFLLAHVLGQRSGGTVGILYIFGMAVSISLFSTGFGESMAETTGWDSPWAVRVIGLITALILLVVVLAGVKWVVKLQLLLLAILMLSVLDFLVGTFAHTDYSAGFTGYSAENMEKNSPPKFSDDQNFFSVFGVFFPSATGVLAGINMSGDLKDPSSNIPAGTLAALGFSGMLYILFALLLGAVCSRHALLTDYMIASKVSLVGVLFLFGLYISSLSSCLGAQYGAPRVLQCISKENVLPIIKPLGKGHGPNQEPYLAAVCVAIIAAGFIMIGNLNALAPIVTMPFLLTYAAIDYAYFKLAMSYDIREQQKLAGRNKPPDSTKTDETKLISYESKGDGKKTSYGSGSFEKHDFGNVKFSQLDITEKDDSTEKENLDKDEVLDNTSPLDMDNKKLETKLNLEDKGDELDEESTRDSTPLLENESNKVNIKEGKQVEIDHGTEARRRKKERKNEDYYHEEHQIKWEIEKQPTSFYSDLCNRWVSLAGTFASLLIMFLINWGYALANISVALLVYIYIGQANPGLSKGCASEFVFSKWVQSLWDKLTRKESTQQQIVVPISGIPYQMSTYQLTEENTDFSYRDKRHHSSMVTSIGPQ
ncbi:unnamed protein product [Porites lobata]|uniref:Amino acid permease/ SLC12A domain-containing protein n=1 Tax=Porites lobata TaxID=104759 RepID=A0ABN8RK11_9CNID|nr:unnamed protein product [Porites lobata]